MGRLRQKGVLSVELSANAVRAMALERSGAGARVSLSEWRALPPPSSPEARRAGLASAAREIALAVDEGPGRESLGEIRLIVSGAALTLRPLRMPPMPRREIPAAARYRLPEIVAVPVEKLVLDILPGAEGLSRGVAGSTVLVAAFERAELDQILGAFEGAGLRPTSVIPLGVALVMAESIPLEPPADEGGPEKGRALRGVLDIGATHSCIVFERGGSILLTRDIGIGGDHFTQALTRELGLGPDEAEKLKRVHGIPDPSDTAGPGEDPSLVPSIRNLLRPLAERLISEVNRSIEFTLQEHGGPGLTDLLMTGGGSALRGLAAGLAEGLGVGVRVFRPRADSVNLAPALGARREAKGDPGDAILGSQSAACLGAAWETPAIDLLAPRGLPAPRRRRPPAAALLAAGAIVLGIHAGSLWRAGQRLDATLHRQESRIRSLAPDLERRGTLSPEIVQALTGAIDFERTFQALGAVIPPGVLIESIRLEPPDRSSPAPSRPGRTFRIEGFASGAPEGAEQNLARLLAGVEQSGSFENVQRVRSAERSRRDSSSLGFAFTFDIEEGAGPQEGMAPGEEP